MVSVAPEHLSATGNFSISQSDFRIDPPGAAGGLVKVRDELEIAFSLHARPNR